jgi:hypothetical protein
VQVGDATPSEHNLMISRNSCADKGVGDFAEDYFGDRVGRSGMV